MDDEITGVEETDALESSTDEQDFEEVADETDIDYGQEETDSDDSTDENENLVPQSRFSKVVSERNSEREAKEQMAKELEFYKNFVTSNNNPATEQPATPKGVDYSKYMNEDGELDLNSYSRDLADQIRNEVKNEVKQEMDYDNMTKKEMDDATSTYPELKDNPDLMGIVKSIKTQTLIDGKYVTYKEIADNVFAQFGKYREAGAESVKRSEKIQSGAGLVNMGSTESKTSKGTLTNADVARMSVTQYEKALNDGSIEKGVRAGTIKGMSIN